MGRAGDAEAVEKVIRDDLGSLEKLNKKLTEVYTNLSRVPLEMTEKEDAFEGKPTEEKVIETPLEVTEEDKEEVSKVPPVAPKAPLPTAPRVTPKVAPKPQRPQAPSIQTEGIPNV
jgi:hypothetical protein